MGPSQYEVGAASVLPPEQRTQRQEGKDENDLRFMLLAIEQALLSGPVSTAYSVGAVLVSWEGTVLSTGYSRELPGNTHAEECCLLKLASPDTARGATIYTTMEPCGRRLSGKTPCAKRLLDAGVTRCVLGAREPNTFIKKSTGVEELRRAGIEVVELAMLVEECLAPNKHVIEGNKA